MERAYRYDSRIPTAEELYALDRRAREERARVIAAAFASAVSALKSLLARGAAARQPKGVRHA